MSSSIRKRKQISFYLLDGHTALKNAQLALVRAGGEITALNNLAEVAFKLFEETALTPEGQKRINDLLNELASTGKE